MVLDETKASPFPESQQKDPDPPFFGSPSPGSWRQADYPPSPPRSFPPDYDVTAHMEFLDIYDEVRKKFITKIVREDLAHRFAEHPEYLNSTPDFQRMLADSVTRHKEANKDLALWITVNPPDGTAFYTLKKAVDHFIGSTWVRSVPYIYCYEQRSEDPLKPTGFHVHILAWFWGMPKSDAIRRVQGTEDGKFTSPFRTKRFGIPDMNFRSVHVKSIGRAEAMRKIEYVRGHKIDKKMTKVDADKVWRKSVDISDCYTSENFDDLIAQGPPGPNPIPTRSKKS